MNILIYTISVILFCSIFLTPAIILYNLVKRKVRYQFVIYLLLGGIVGTILIFIFSSWAITSDEMLLRHYEFDFEAMNDTEKYKNVLPQNLNEVKNIESSLSGIGWQLKAIFAFAFFLLYLLFFYFVNCIIRKRKAHN